MFMVLPKRWDDVIGLTRDTSQPDKINQSHWLEIVSNHVKACVTMVRLLKQEDTTSERVHGGRPPPTKITISKMNVFEKSVIEKHNNTKQKHNHVKRISLTAPVFKPFILQCKDTHVSALILAFNVKGSDAPSPPKQKSVTQSCERR